MMNKNILEGRWKQIRGEAKVRWGKLTHDDLEKINGRYDKIMGLLQVKYGNTQQEWEKRTK
jgi:uncharacterized protein YjbJ (UPF0337 family)